MSHQTRPRAATAVTVAAGVVMAVVAGLVGRLRTSEPLLLGRENPDPATSVLHAAVGAVFWGALVVTLAELLLATICSNPGPLEDSSRRIGRRAWAAAQVWTISALLMVPLEAADSVGLAVDQVIPDMATHITSTPSVTAWLVTAVLGLVVALVALMTASVGGLVIASALTLLSCLPVTITGSVSVGLDHDFATDAGALAALCLTAACASAVAIATGDPRTGRARAARLRWPIRICLVLAVIASQVVTWQGQAGRTWTADRWGVARLVLTAVLVIWAVASFLPFSHVTMALGVVAAAMALTVTGACSQLIPPRYLVGQTPAVNYLGYELPPAPTVGRLMAPGRPNIGFWTLSVAGVAGYLLAVAVLHRRGERWSRGRTGSWISAWVVVAYLATAGLWEYSSMQFSWHMLVHMTFNMLVPALLVLGAPVTLLREALPTTDDLLGPRDCLVKALEWRPTKVLLGPFAGWIVFIASFYVVYFTPVFGYLMRYHWGHQWMLAHFMAAGFMLFEYVIGLDELPASLPHIGRLGFVITAMPFHSFFAVITMNAHQIIGQEFYRALSAPWVGDLRADQNLGGQITWATGEIPMALVLIALCVQWFVADRRDQRRVDQAEDSGLDASLAAYNEMLARMAGQTVQDDSTPASPPDPGKVDQ